MSASQPLPRNRARPRTDARAGDQSPPPGAFAHSTLKADWACLFVWCTACHHQGPQTLTGHAAQITVVDTILTQNPPPTMRGGGGETSIAINPRNKSQIAITAFELHWRSGGLPASLIFSTDCPSSNDLRQIGL